MADIKLKDIGGEEKTYSGIKHVKMPGSTGELVEFDLEATVQEKSVEIAQNGTTEVTPDAGYDGLSKVTVTTNVPSSGGETEEVTVDLSMADGNQVITPSAGKTISKATITKPDTLIPANIKKDIVIGGVTGIYETSDLSAFISEAWSDDNVLCDNNFGIARRNNTAVADQLKSLEITLWYNISNNSNPFGAYQNYFTKDMAWGLITDTKQKSLLNEFCRTTIGNFGTWFGLIFNNATKACFMDDDHPVPKPELPATAQLEAIDDFMNAFQSTLAGLPQSYGDGYMSTFDYGFCGNSSILFNNDKRKIRFLWYPAVEDGEPRAAYYLLQNPTGTMTTYENGVKNYNGTTPAGSHVGELFYVNPMSEYGITHPLIVEFLTSDEGSKSMLVYSGGEQTVLEAVAKNLNGKWAYGNISLNTGWNVVQGQSDGTNVVTPLTEEMSNIIKFDLNYFPYSEMDTYEKSIFNGVLKQFYKRLNQNYVSIEFNQKYVSQ
nr:MAG TPA: hypothetical protein [Caudoviricetes sp.]